MFFDPYNYSQIVGNTGSDPEIKYFENGRYKVGVNVAVRRPGKIDGEEKPPVWVPVRFFGEGGKGRGESFAEHVKKGASVMICGRWEVHEWTDQSGEKRKLPYIEAFEWKFWGKKADGPSGDRGMSGPDDSPSRSTGTSKPKGIGHHDAEPPADLDDEIPF